MLRSNARPEKKPAVAARIMREGINVGLRIPNRLDPSGRMHQNGSEKSQQDSNQSAAQLKAEPFTRPTQLREGQDKTHNLRY